MQPYTTDTSPEAEEVQFDLIRRMPPSERALKSLRMTTRLIRECKAAIARNNPGLTQRQIGIAFIELNYGKELAAAVDHYQSERAMDNNEDLVSALQTIRATFDSLQIRYFIGGSVASSFHGAMRSTMDVDLVADLGLEHIGPILSAVADEFYANEPAIRDAIQRRSAFNLIHLPTSFKIDIFLSRGRGFDESSFARATISRLGTAESGIDVPIASAEDILLAKLDWYRLGNEASERQWDDVSRLVKLNRGNLDWAYLDSVAEEICVTELLDRLRNL